MNERSNTTASAAADSPPANSLSTYESTLLSDFFFFFWLCSEACGIESFPTRDQIHIPFIGRQSCNH